MAGDLSCQ